MMEAIGRKKASGVSSARIIVSAGFLVRLPFTPLQYEAPDFDREKLERISYRMNEACEKAGLEFRLASDIEESFVDQALSLAGSAVYPWLEKIPDMRIVYDSSLGKDSWKSLRPYLWGKTQDRLFHSEKPEDYRPPLPYGQDPRLRSSPTLSRSERLLGQAFLPWESLFGLRRLRRSFRNRDDDRASTRRSAEFIVAAKDRSSPAREVEIPAGLRRSRPAARSLRRRSFVSQVVGSQATIRQRRGRRDDHIRREGSVISEDPLRTACKNSTAARRSVPMPL